MNLLTAHITLIYKVTFDSSVSEDDVRDAINEHFDEYDTLENFTMDGVTILTTDRSYTAI